MNHLLAKTRGKNGDFFKVLSNKNFYNIPSDLSDAVAYSPGYKLDEEEWFAIEKFTLKPYCIDLLKSKFVSTSFDQLPKAKYEDIECLCANQNSYFLFQKVTPGQLIMRRYLSLSNTPTLIDSTPLLVLREYPDAVYDQSADTVYFKSLSGVSSIFKGIDQLYREATNVETKDFLDSDFIELGDNYSFAKVKKANRKRIAMALDTLNGFSPQIKKQMIKYIREYSKLSYDAKSKTFKIEKEEELKMLLFGIEERFYTTSLNKEKRLANSVIKLEM
jgi:hypothetical protein